MAQTENKLRIPETLRKVKNIVGIFSAKGGKHTEHIPIMKLF